MERLQAALEKARDRRRRTAKPAGPVKSAQIEAALWDALPRFETNQGHLRRKRVFLDAQSPEATHFDLLRTKILQKCRDNNWRRVLVTSPTKSCGKTTICSNIAASFARQTARSLILMDFDMRRPELAKIFGLRGAQSVHDVLEERVMFQHQALRLSDTVAISANHAPAANPAKLILEDTSHEVIDAIERDYAPDIFMFDTPPLLVADDTLALLKFVDCALIVAAAEQTTTDQLDQCEKEIADHTNVMGVVLNRCHYSKPSYGYEYSY